jgi:hypothetical protein
VVFFDKNFERWSFLTLRWRRWSLLSKIPGSDHTMPAEEITRDLFDLGGQER